jgi:hypothetical protein
LFFFVDVLAETCLPISFIFAFIAHQNSSDSPATTLTHFLPHAKDRNVCRKSEKPYAMWNFAVYLCCTENSFSRLVSICSGAKKSVGVIEGKACQ